MAEKKIDVVSDCKKIYVRVRYKLKTLKNLKDFKALKAFKTLKVILTAAVRIIAKLKSSRTVLFIAIFRMKIQKHILNKSLIMVAFMTGVVSRLNLCLYQVIIFPTPDLNALVNLNIALL